MRIIRVVVLAAAVLVAVLGVLGFRDYSRSPYNGIQHHNLVVQGVAPKGPNRGLPLEPGDRIVAVGGVRLRNLNHYNYLISSNTGFAALRFTIARGDSTFAANVRHSAQPADRISRRLALTIVGCTLLFVGFIVAVKRPDVLGLLFMVNCFILSFLITERPVTSVPVLQIGGELIYDFLFILLPATFLHFSLLFPGRDIERGTRRSRVIEALYFPPALIYLTTFVLALWNYSAGVRENVIDAVNSLTVVYWSLYMLSSIVVFVRTYATSERVQRVKLTIVAFGVALGIIPMSVLMLIKQFQPTAYVPLMPLSVLCLSLISISFAYAILKQGTFDIGIVLRGSLVYAVIAVLAVAFYYAVVSIVGERYGRALGLHPTFWNALALIVIALSIIPARALLQRIVDRAFRGRKVFKDEIIAFSREIQSLLSPEEVASFVVNEMLNLFQAESVHLFLAEGSSNYTLRLSAPAERRLALTSFAPGTDLIALMRGDRLPVMLEYFDKLWMRNNLDRISRELVSLSRAAVAVPLIEGEALRGFLLIGRKRSGKPYTRSDSEILEVVGGRTALALANIRLCRESIDKGKLDEELRLASEIQKRLLPVAPPPLRGASIGGGLRTSREIGGDFYDFVDLGPGKVGIVVADVSGKGIPAALLMTTLQASFRAAAARSQSPGQILSALNTFLYERSDPEKFASAFYAIYEEETGALHYANAGSYPPFVLGPDGKMSRLLRGGTLIGLDPSARFDEGITKLRPGDLLVVYTDGFIDQEDPAGAPFGEQRLVEFFRNSAQLSIDNIVQKLFATCIAFGQNNIKDDMTVVLLRRNPR